MKSRVRLLIVALVVLPLLALAVFAWRAARTERTRVRAELMEERTRRLQDRATELIAVLPELARTLLESTADLPRGEGDLRAFIATRPHLRRLLILDEGGAPTFPSAATSDDDLRWLSQTRALWGQDGLLRRVRLMEMAAHDQGWLPLPGQQPGGLLFWRLIESRVVAVAVPADTLLAAFIDRLPATDATTARDRVALIDPTGQVAYQWGGHAPAPQQPPRASVTLAAPLSLWRLEDRGPPPSAVGQVFGLLAGAAALGIALSGVGVWLYRESTRELRDAAQRVSFVNQVSHELKTPLTNVRMYAELLEDHVELNDVIGRQRLGIVVSESERLSRLIANILTFARSERGPLSVQLKSGCVDEIVRDVLARFEPAFAAVGVTVQTKLSAAERVRVDADALTQILGNLFGNVEKYAPGSELTVSTTQETSLTTITVRDGGPGIVPEERQRVFDPFVRLGGVRHEGVAGTGIGLGIARDLARLHGGDVRVADGTSGATFVVTLRTERSA